MRNFFLPAVRFLDRLSYWQKFAVVGFLFVLPIIIVTYLFIQNVQEKINFISKEQAGVTYIKMLADLMEDYQLLSDDPGSKDKWSEVKKHIVVIDTFNSSNGASLEVSAEWQIIKNQLQVFSGWYQDAKEEELKNTIKEINHNTINLISSIGNNSNLILDPNFDSYYLMDSIVLKLPALYETINEINLIISQASEDKTLTSSQLLKLVSLRNSLNENYEAVKSDFNLISINATIPDIKKTLDAPYYTFERRVQSFIDFVDYNFINKSGTIIISHSKIFNAKKAAISSLFKLHDAYSGALGHLLTTRLGQEPVKIFLSTIVTVIAAFLIIYLLIAFYLEQARKDAEIARQQAEAANQKKSKFLTLMSHEFKTPLNSIIGYSDMLESSIAGELNEKQQKFIRNIASSGQHMLKMVNELLDLAKIEAGKIELNLENIDSKIFIGELQEIVRELAVQKNIRIRFSIEPSLNYFKADPQYLRQIFLNLISNAIKFSNEGGNISVSIFKKRGWVTVTVSDNGIGIPKDKQAGLFTEFYQVDNRYSSYYEKGTGLGLALTKRLVELHGGSISLKSDEGIGTTVTFTIPFVIEKAPYATPPVTVSQGKKKLPVSSPKEANISTIKSQ